MRAGEFGSPAGRHYVAVFGVSLALLVLEIAVARLLSVALVSHYAFVAISLAMFGIGASGLIVYLLPDHFRRSEIDRQLVFYASCFGVTATASVVSFMSFHVVQELSWSGFWTLGVAYLMLTVPFFFGGICISLLMTHFADQIGRIYAADLIGASLGCMLVVGAMELMPTPLVSLAVAILVSAAALLVGLRLRPRRLLSPLIACGIVSALAISSLTTDAYRIKHVNVRSDYYSDYEVWNSFSRVSAFHPPDGRNAAQFLPMPAGFSEYAGGDYPGTMVLDIDGAAFTPMLNFNGDFDSIEFLKQSVLYAVHHVRPDADVLLIGLGGGRDILAALAFEQRSVLGIELNPLMPALVDGMFGDYSGRPYSLPGVEVMVDEARNRLHRIDRRFDVIQLSMIDTLSLNAAGGFVFSENNLYTIEGFREYYRHLTDSGIVNLTRYYMPVYPVEILKLVVLGRKAWEAEGVANYADHVVVLSSLMTGTVLIKKTPYTAEELGRLQELADAGSFEIVYAPGKMSRHGRAFKLAASTPDLQGFVDRHPRRIDAPTDDQPFFWSFLRGRLDEVPGASKDPFQFLRLWDDALALMYLLIFVVVAFAVVFFVVPLVLLARVPENRAGIRRTSALLVYFACLGYGFLTIEIPLLQHFILLLGKPVYAMTVVLFSLLLFSGIGSLVSGRFEDPSRSLRMALGAILLLSLTYVFLLPSAITSLLGLATQVRIGAAVALLAPIGLVLGMAYPLGIRVLTAHVPDLVPWAWGINGALSVVASVLAIYSSSRIGFAATMLTGIAAYAVGLICMLLVRETPRAA
jgi:spermidine synthase